MAGSGFFDFFVADWVAAMVSPQLPWFRPLLAPAWHSGKLTFTKTLRVAVQKFQLTLFRLIQRGQAGINYFAGLTRLKARWPGAIKCLPVLYWRNLKR
jgi:hypothetical protein